VIFRKTIFLFVLITFSLSRAQTKIDTLNYLKLINRISDLEYLATIPKEKELSGSFSSYDRRSIYDNNNQKYIDWHANSDGRGYIRKEGDDIVVFEKNGPGVIWRFWSALAKEGHIKIFIDNKIQPVIDQPFRDFFETVNKNEIPPLNYPSLVMTLSRGRNRFIPISYNKHCKIVLSKNWGAYYHITYTDFPKNTFVESFKEEFSKQESILLAETDRYLANRGYENKVYANQSTVKKKITLHAKKNNVIKIIKGNKAITQIKFEIDENLNTEDKKELLSKLWLSIKWDREQIASVNSPFGMFFGSYPEIYNYRALPIGVIGGDTFYSNWYMPFSSQAKIEIINKSEKKFSVKVHITEIPLINSADNLLRFNAKWHDGSIYLDNQKNINLSREEIETTKNGRIIDWIFLKTQAKGRYCGITLHIKNIWDEPVELSESWWYGKWNKKTIDWWWGEGDEKFFVDGEKMPSTFGTGSEDYIGYAWSAEPPFPNFDSPFASQPFTPVNGNGHTIVNRFHIADNIPFHDSFEGVIEKYKSYKWFSDKKNISTKGSTIYDVVVYWYQK